MRLGSFRYLVKQGWYNLAANRLMTFASVGVLTACLIITGIATLLSFNVNRVIDYFGEQNEIVAYLVQGLTPEQVNEMQAQIQAMPNVLEVHLVTQEDAYAQMQTWLEQYGGLLEGYESIFPASFRVTVDDLSLMTHTNEQLRSLAGVEDTAASAELAGVMVTVKNAVNYGGWVLVAMLAVVSVIVISNTIRLTVFARRREISIMKYVGATNAFIRLPFFVEGMTVGLIAGLVATGIVTGSYYLVYGVITESSNLWVISLISSLLKPGEVWYWLLGGFVGFGFLIGGFGTATSVKKHLKV